MSAPVTEVCLFLITSHEHVDISSLSHSPPNFLDYKAILVAVNLLTLSLLIRNASSPRPFPRHLRY